MSDSALIAILIQAAVGVATIAKVTTNIDWLKKGQEGLEKRVKKLEEKGNVSNIG